MVFFVRSPTPKPLHPHRGRLERILSSLTREWLRITNEFLIVEDPEPAPRSPNKLMRVNRAERRKVVRALSSSKRRTEILVR